MGIFEQAWSSTFREKDESILIGGLTEFDLRVDIRDVLHSLSPDDFFQPSHGRIWGVARELADKSRIITLDNFRSVLDGRDFEVLDRAQGQGVRSVEVNRGAKYVADAAKKRRLLNALKQGAITCQRSEQYEPVLAAMHTLLVELDEAEVVPEAATAQQLVEDFWESWESPEDDAPVVPTPWIQFNELLVGGGLGYGTLNTFAAASGRGKSLAMLNIAAYAALKGYKVAVFSMEMPKREVFSRMMASQAGVKTGDIARRQADNATLERLIATSESYRESTLQVWDTSETADISADFIRQQCTAMQRTVGLDLVVVDYVQIMPSPKYGDNREQQVSENTRLLKKVALSLGVVLITASQMNETEEGQTPTLRSLRESRGIGNNSDTVTFLKHMTDADGMPDGSLDLVLAKQRNGRNGSVPLVWGAHMARLTEPYGMR